MKLLTTLGRALTAGIKNGKICASVVRFEIELANPTGIIQKKIKRNVAKLTSNDRNLKYKKKLF